MARRTRRLAARGRRGARRRWPDGSAALACRSRSHPCSGLVSSRCLRQSVRPVATGEETGRTDERRGHRRCHFAPFADAALAAKRLGLRCSRTARGTRLPDRSVLLGKAPIAEKMLTAVSDLPGRARFCRRYRPRGAARRSGAEFPILLRISQWKQQDFEVRLADTPQALEAWAQPLVDAGVDILHCSQRRFWEPEFEGSDLNFAGWAKKVTGAPTISVGSVGLSGEFIASYRRRGLSSGVPRRVDPPARSRGVRPRRGRHGRCFRIHSGC